MQDMNDKNSLAQNTQFVYTDTHLLKVIDDGDGLRLKICPRVMEITFDGSEQDCGYDEHDGAVEVTLNKRTEVNFLVGTLRRFRNRVWGADE